MKEMNEENIPVLNGRQVRYLRGLGHHLEPVAMLGKEGMTANVAAAMDANLFARELIKIKIQQNCPLDRREAAVLASSAVGAAVVQILGRTVLLYRPNPELPWEKRIHLP